jgi:hypothetical protein
MIGFLPNLGLAEVIVLLLIGCFLLVVPTAVVLLVVFLVRKGQNQPVNDYPALLEENRRLQEEIARLKKKQA